MVFVTVNDFLDKEETEEVGITLELQVVNSGHYSCSCSCSCSCSPPQITGLWESSLYNNHIQVLWERYIYIAHCASRPILFLYKSTESNLVPPGFLMVLFLQEL